MLQVGQEVICIDDNWNEKDGEHPKKGRTYIIRGIQAWNGVAAKQCPHLEFLEFCGYCYAQENFRPVIKRKTDISVFTALLNTKKATQDS
jgi:hypothetical protein